MLDESFMDVPIWRAQIAAAYAIRRDPEDPIRFTYIAIRVFLGLVSQVVIQSQE
jgi:hypothetical protein